MASDQLQMLLYALDLQCAAYGVTFDDLHSSVEHMLGDLEECWEEQRFMRCYQLPDFIELQPSYRGVGLKLTLHWGEDELDVLIIPDSEINRVVELILRNIPE